MIRFTDFGLQQLSRQAQISGSETLHCSTTLTAKGCCGPTTSTLPSPSQGAEGLWNS